jgi:hypothetical protein
LYLINPESLREKFKSAAKSLDVISPSPKIEDQPSTTLADTVNHDPQPSTEYIEIDDVSEGFDSKEECKDEI